MLQGRNKAFKHRVRPIRPRLEFWMELACDKERMVFGLDNLDKVIVWRCSTGDNTPLFVLVTVIIITLVTVAVALGYKALSV